MSVFRVQKNEETTKRLRRSSQRSRRVTKRPNSALEAQGRKHFKGEKKIVSIAANTKIR